MCPFVGFRLSLKLLLQHPQQTGGSRTMFGSLPLQTGSCDFHHLSEQVLFFGSFNVITRVRRPHIGRYLSLQDGMNTHSISEELPRVPKVSNTLTVSSQLCTLDHYDLSGSNPQHMNSLEFRGDINTQNCNFRHQVPNLMTTNDHKCISTTLAGFKCPSNQADRGQSFKWRKQTPSHDLSAHPGGSQPKCWLQMPNPRFQHKPYSFTAPAHKHIGP